MLLGEVSRLGEGLTGVSRTLAESNAAWQRRVAELESRVGATAATAGDAGARVMARSAAVAADVNEAKVRVARACLPLRLPQCQAAQGLCAHESFQARVCACDAAQVAAASAAESIARLRGDLQVCVAVFPLVGVTVRRGTASRA